MRKKAPTSRQLIDPEGMNNRLLLAEMPLDTISSIVNSLNATEHTRVLAPQTRGRDVTVYVGSGALRRRPMTGWSRVVGDNILSGAPGVPARIPEIK